MLSEGNLWKKLFTCKHHCEDVLLSAAGNRWVKEISEWRLCQRWSDTSHFLSLSLSLALSLSLWQQMSHQVDLFWLSGMRVDWMSRAGPLMIAALWLFHILFYAMKNKLSHQSCFHYERPLPEVDLRELSPQQLRKTSIHLLAIPLRVAGGWWVK